ncbi:ribonuclease H2 subunit A-like [Tubulanus polymorphus]|uniref:ribonuclease H2 subunit A-like n=1 Tax=Tubulanus polymorphus TaxID=672921 RepID=UPI003DA4033F
MKMDIKRFTDNNTQNLKLECDVPEICKVEPCCLGIDEAGRGPVLGPMVYGISYCPVASNDKLKEIGFADSKTLTEEQREELFTKLEEAEEMIGWTVDILSPHYISTSMLKRAKYNLNAISHDTAIGLIQRSIERGVNLTEVYVDTVGPPEKYQEKLSKIFPNLNITVAKKADSIYPIVSAASICAKVARDRATKSWEFTEGEKIKVPEGGFGSGYPADPQTKKFMVDSIDPVFGFPHFVRISWSTAYSAIEKKCVPVHWDDEDDDEPMKKRPKNTPALTSFFKSVAKQIKAKNHVFFKDRCLKSVQSF